jgi:hypothetical protein
MAEFKKLSEEDAATAVALADEFEVLQGGTNKRATMDMIKDLLVGDQSEATLTTVGAGTITAAMLLSGDVLRSGPTGAFTDTTSTAALLQAAWKGAASDSFQFTYKNTTNFDATLAAGSGVTMSGNTIVPANSWARFLVVWTGTNTATIYWIAGGEYTPLPNAKYSTSSVTTGSLAAGLITGARMCVWQQTGATPGAQLVRTAAQMLADIPNGRVGTSWRFRIANTGAGTLTLTTDAGATVTMSGDMTVPQNTWRDFIGTILSATTASVQSVAAGELTPLPNTKYSTSSVTTGSLAAGTITGARKVHWRSTNAVPGAQLVRTAAQMLADIPGAHVGFTWEFRIINNGAGTLTLTADSGATVTLAGTMTVAQNTWRDFVASIDSATTATITAVGIGTDS